MIRYRFGSFELQTETAALVQNGTPLPLTRRKFELLLLLVSEAGRVVTKEEIIARIWSDQVVEESNLTQQIYNLRRTLGEDSRNPEFILTVPGVGYRFNPPVEVIDDGEAFSESTFSRPSGATTPSLSHQELPPVSLSDSRQSARKNRLLQDRRRVDGWPGRLLLVIVLVGLGSIGAWVLQRTGLLDGKSGVPNPRVSLLASLPGIESYPAFSPDGKFIAFTSDGGENRNEDIFVRLIGEGRTIRLTNDLVSETHVVWSPDGLQIAFLRTPKEAYGRFHILVMSALGGSEREIGRAWGGLDWSPDGRYLAVSDFDQDQRPSRITLISPDGSQRLPLPPPTPGNVNTFDNLPRFSPNGKEIAFVRWSSDQVSDIFVVNIASRSMRQLTFDRKRVPSLQWDPDGDEILFVSNRQGRNQLWKISAQGGSPKLIPQLGDNFEHIAISRQGKKLAFTQQIYDTTIEIYPLSPADPALPLSKPLCTIDSSRTELSPRFSPDGSKLVYTSAQTGWDEIWIAKADCTDQQQLTQFKESGVGSPRWSPDGESIVFDRRANGQADIFTIHTLTREVRQLTYHPAADTMPAWSPDGNWIFFTSERTNQRQIWKVPSIGGTALQVTRDEGQEPILSSNGEVIFFVRQGNLYELLLSSGVERAVSTNSFPSIQRQWTLSNNLLYFISISAQGEQILTQIDPLTRKRTALWQVNRTFFRFEPGLSISPDQKWVAFSFINHRLGDLMIAEDWD
jgi:Tol biopolymer transport system component/DNA-binding winged helix-turn-helix (wHTH) protein